MSETINSGLKIEESFTRHPSVFGAIPIGVAFVRISLEKTDSPIESSFISIKFTLQSVLSLMSLTSFFALLQKLSFMLKTSISRAPSKAA